MKNATFLFAALAAGLALVPAAIAQDQPAPAAAPVRQAEPEHFYKITFVVQELNAEGRPVNSRSYVTSVSTTSHPSELIRTGSRVPITTSQIQSSGEKSTVSQFQYIDIGVRFDIRDVHESGQQLAMIVKAEISSIAPSSDSKLPQQPVIRSNQWESPVLLPVGKATSIFTSDDLDSKGALQIVATATLLQ